jgi:nonsense-mediated mRNA decay protein 3
MVCPLCGGKSEVGLFCSECYLKKNLKIELPSVIQIEKCRGCGIYNISGKQIRLDSEEKAMLMAGDRALKTNINRLDKAGVLKTGIEQSGGDNIFRAKVILSDREVEKTAIIRINSVSCPDCSRMAGGYYEAVLQLRGGFSKKMMEKIITEVEGHKDRYSFVSQIKKVPNGYDIYLGSKRSAEKIVKQYRGKAEIKKSFEQVGMDKQTSKAKNRFYYLIRL